MLREASRCHSDRGSISPFLLLLMPALVGLAGLVYDGGMLFAARREAVNVAAAAARAGANDLDEASVRSGEPELAPSASATARNFALSQGVDTADARLLADDLVQVSVAQTVDMVFLQALGVPSQTVQGVAEATVTTGTEE